MLKQVNHWLFILATVLVSRFIGMAFFPFADTTESRYAEISRLMAETGDWITPWFEPGTPFWGKPPLSFWAQAASIKLFGLSEFALRLPSWLVTVLMVWLVWLLARKLYTPQVAKWSSLTFASMAITYVSAGAVMTDAFLALGTTLTLVSFCLVMAGHSASWRWLFFLGIAIGLLAKGPLALVLVGIPITLWLFLSWRDTGKLRQFPWFRGTLIVLLLAGPWYLLAELKTPGFLDYFIIGEHIRRFIEPGWTGDLYGTAHDQPKGMIWLYWMLASLPWGIAALADFALTLIRKQSARVFKQFLSKRSTQFLLLCALSPMLFFSLAGNILWTYILPSLPFTAILIGRWVSILESPWFIHMRYALVAFVPILLNSLIIQVCLGWQPFKSEKDLVNYYQATKGNADSPLIYLDSLPFSAMYYSRGVAQSLSENNLNELIKANKYKTLYIAVPHGSSYENLPHISIANQPLVENKRFQLFLINGLLDTQQQAFSLQGRPQK